MSSERKQTDLQHPFWYVLRTHMRELQIAAYLKERRGQGDSVDFYIPAYEAKDEKISTRTVRRELLSHDGTQTFFATQTLRSAPREVHTMRPVLSGYVLVRATQMYLESLDIWCSWMFPIVRTDFVPGDLLSGLRYVTITETQLMQFRTVINAYQQAGIQSLTLHTDLVEGDEVRVIAGPFAGLKGILQTSQGRQGGNVIVRLTGNICYSTLPVSVDDLEVIRFSKKSYHVYKKFKAYGPRILDIMQRLHEQHGELSSEDIATCLAFVRRYPDLILDTDNARAQYYAYQLLTYTALEKAGVNIGRYRSQWTSEGCAEEAAHESDSGSGGKGCRVMQASDCLARCLDLLPRLRTDYSQVFLLTYLYIATQIPDYQQQCAFITSPWLSADGTPAGTKYNEKKYTTLLATLARFRQLYTPVSTFHSYHTRSESRSHTSQPNF